MIDVRRTRASIAAHAFQRANREQIEIEFIDVDSPARDLVQLLPGYLTG
jgi:hypothetical protein